MTYQNLKLLLSDCMQMIVLCTKIWAVDRISYSCRKTSTTWPSGITGGNYGSVQASATRWGLHVRRHLWSKTTAWIMRNSQVVSETPYFGIQLQDDLKWYRHVDYVSGKASRTLSMLKCDLRMNDIKVKNTAYITLVRPTMEYVAIAWDPYMIKY